MANYKTLLKGEWLEMRETDNYAYAHEVKVDAKKVALLVIDTEKPDQVLGRYEKVPPHFDEIGLVSITGGVEEGDDFLDCAVAELMEETGYEAKRNEFLDLGTCFPSKMMDSFFHMYAVDVSGKEASNPEGDGSEGEKTAYVKWVSVDDAIMCKDPLMATLIIRLIKKQRDEEGEY